MTVAALYDVHGNLPALEAVFAEVDADAILVGGDVALGPMPKETLALLREHGATFIRGNCDREVTAPGEGGEIWTRRARWVHEQLDDEELTGGSLRVGEQCRDRCFQRVIGHRAFVHSHGSGAQHDVSRLGGRVRRCGDVYGIVPKLSGRLQSAGRHSV